MWHLPDVRRHGVVPALELPHHRRIAAMPVLQGGAKRTLVLNPVVV
jgi:hypothetical protein